MQGGTAQGIGWALNEEYYYDSRGSLRNIGLLDYRMPTCLDLPMIETAIVEVPAPGHPIGSRGVGEVSIVPPPAAVANAICSCDRRPADGIADVTAAVLKAHPQKSRKRDSGRSLQAVDKRFSAVPMTGSGSAVCFQPNSPRRANGRNTA